MNSEHDLARTITRWREGMGWSMHELARAAGVSVAYVSRLEAGI